MLTAAAAEVGTRAFGDPVGTFVGAMVMTAAALLLGRRPGLPPARTCSTSAGSTC